MIVFSGSRSLFHLRVPVLFAILFLGLAQASKRSKRDGKTTSYSFSQAVPVSCLNRTM